MAGECHGDVDASRGAVGGKCVERKFLGLFATVEERGALVIRKTRNKLIEEAHLKDY